MVGSCDTSSSVLIEGALSSDSSLSGGAGNGASTGFGTRVGRNLPLLPCFAVDSPLWLCDLLGVVFSLTRGSLLVLGSAGG